MFKIQHHGAVACLYLDSCRMYGGEKILVRFPDGSESIESLVLVQETGDGGWSARYTPYIDVQLRGLPVRINLFAERALTISLV